MTQLIISTVFFFVWSAGPSAGASTELATQRWLVTMRAGRVYLLVWNGFVWESGNMPIYLATHVSVWFLFVSKNLQRSFFFPPAGCVWFVAALRPRPEVQLRWTPLFMPLKVTRELLWHISICAHWTFVCVGVITELCACTDMERRAPVTVLTASLDSQWGSLSAQPLKALTPMSPWFLHTQQHTHLSLTLMKLYAVDGCEGSIEVTEAHSVQTRSRWDEQ